MRKFMLVYEFAKSAKIPPYKVDRLVKKLGITLVKVKGDGTRPVNAISPEDQEKILSTLVPSIEDLNKRLK